jgi:hypothetical protein
MHEKWFSGNTNERYEYENVKAHFSELKIHIVTNTLTKCCKYRITEMGKKNGEKLK